MAKAAKIYRKLPGQGATMAHHVRLYMAADHLLQVFSNGFTETYKRFYFRDIQAITIRKTNIGAVINAGILGVGAIFAVITFFSLNANAIAFGIVGGIIALALGANVALGPTAVCHIRTAVQTEKLPSLSRVWRARRVLARIRPLIEQAQGQMSETAAREQLGGSAPSAPPTTEDSAPLSASGG